MKRIGPVAMVGVLVRATGTALAAVLHGTAGPDTLNWTSSADETRGLPGNDTLDRKGGNDAVYGGRGVDRISGGAGRDRIYGGNDNIDSRDGSSRDYVSCGPGYGMCNAEPQPGVPQDFIADDCEVGAL